jgi:hypothetical protein
MGVYVDNPLVSIGWLRSRVGAKIWISAISNLVNALVDNTHPSLRSNSVSQTKFMLRQLFMICMEMRPIIKNVDDLKPVYDKLVKILESRGEWEHPDDLKRTSLSALLYNTRDSVLL